MLKGFRKKLDGSSKGVIGFGKLDVGTGRLIDGGFLIRWI